jgi:pimeloyl-ACP methyl ester carboxylesterase
MPPITHHRTATVEGLEIAYREAGAADAPTVVLLHGYPTSSAMYRDLIPLLADRFHVVAPDHVGFGDSAAPTVDEFTYTFEALARVTEGLLEQLGLTEYAIMVQDYGAPVGWRLALSGRHTITAIVTQNGNAYEDGFAPEFWAPIWAYGAAPGEETEAGVSGALSLDAIRWQYTHGVPDVSRIDPDNWRRDHALVNRPGNPAIQLALFADYRSNRLLYDQLHEWFRATRVPLLAIWGANDEIFLADGARAFARDLPDAEIHLLDAGHFALESDLDTIAATVRGFLGRTLAQAGPA